MDRFVFIWLRFTGRIKRLTWLAFAILLALLEYLTELFLRAVFHWPLPAEAAGNGFLTTYMGDEISLLASLIFLWPSLAIDVKRWHDLGLSGWFVLIVYAPALALFGFELAGAGGTVAQPDKALAASLYLFGLVVLLYFIILAARKGMPGANRYGPSPD